MQTLSKIHAAPNASLLADARIGVKTIKPISPRAKAILDLADLRTQELVAAVKQFLEATV